jgi:hypothetical protein
VTLVALAPLGVACSSFGSAPAEDAGSSASADAGVQAETSSPVDGATTADVVVPDAAPKPDAGGRVHVFVTQATIFGSNLTKDSNAGAPPRNPIAKATEMCAKEALAAGLTGTYMPWIGTAGSPPGQRLQGNGPWYDPTGNAIVFASRPDKGGVLPQNPIVLSSGMPTTSRVWTGHTANDTCTDWTMPLERATLGNPNDRARWETESSAECGTTPGAIYCFEQPLPEISPGTGGN